MTRAAYQIPASRFEVVVIGGSAGGVLALSSLLEKLPADFPVPILIAQHTGSPSALVDVLRFRSRMPVRWAQAGYPFRPACAYVAPPHHYLRLTADSHCSLQATSTGPTSIDALFESAALHFGPATLAVVLTGAGRDGSQGAMSIRDVGGTVLVQDRETSEHFGMPGAVIESGGAHLALPLATIVDALISLVKVQGVSSLFGLPC